jgi:pyruvate, water dikinase
MKTIRGIGVSKGTGVGKVKIIESSVYFDLVEKGDIVVTKAATPDFVLILDKASCLISDEGGITSHIAIVCREMEKPAIVGTLNGSSVFRNGQIIEFDCSTGIIKYEK